MNALFINGSPRKNWNTYKMLESAMKGAYEAGAKTELINLYDFNFKGCMSCFACKLKNDRTNGVCVIKDDLRPILEKARESDVIVIGSPVYYGYPTAQARAFLERLMFAAGTYLVDENGKYVRKFEKIIPTAMIYTMNCTEEIFDKVHYPALLGVNVEYLGNIFGYSEMLCAYNRYQFSDYSRYAVTMFKEEEKAKYRDEHFSQDLQNAYELGARLVNKASNGQ
ncbi:MAG: flavodoxin family protein [Synergistaceae bacterium]|nr:flavodoxin family protein [Synergistaceae bacterium]